MHIQLPDREKENAEELSALIENTKREISAAFLVPYRKLGKRRARMKRDARV